MKFTDGNPGVTLRMGFLLKKAVTEHNAEYIAKVDDDAYVNIPVLMHMLHRNITDRPFWYGYPIPGAPIDEREIYGMTYARYGPWVDDLIYKPLVPQYMNGALVLFSSVVAEALHAVNSIIGLRMLWDDDVAIGLWLSALDMRYLNDTEAGRFCEALPAHRARLQGMGSGPEGQLLPECTAALCIGAPMQGPANHPKGACHSYSVPRSPNTQAF